MSARAVLSGLLSFISQDIGGINGFLDRFRAAGQGTLLRAWLGGEPVPIGRDTIERALGSDAIERIAARAAVSTTSATSAMALAVPAVVARMAPGGVIPSRLSAELTAYIAAPSGVASTARHAMTPSDLSAAATSGRNWWPLVALMFLIVLILLLVTNRGSTGT